MTKRTLLLDGMSCGHCVSVVRTALETLGSVTVNDVRVGSATVAFDEAQVTPEEISAVMADAGYPVRQVVDAAPNTPIT